MGLTLEGGGEHSLLGAIMNCGAELMERTQRENGREHRNPGILRLCSLQNPAPHPSLHPGPMQIQAQPQQPLIGWIMILFLISFLLRNPAKFLCHLPPLTGMDASRHSVMSSTHTWGYPARLRLTGVPCQEYGLDCLQEGKQSRPFCSSFLMRIAGRQVQYVPHMYHPPASLPPTNVLNFNSLCELYRTCTFQVKRPNPAWDETHSISYTNKCEHYYHHPLRLNRIKKLTFACPCRFLAAIHSFPVWQGEVQYRYIRGTLVGTGLGI